MRSSMPGIPALVDLLAPPRCVACLRRARPPWCPPCRAAARPAPAGCRRCGDPWATHACPAVGTPIVAATACWQYQGPVRAAVAGAKARGAWAGWERLAADLGAHVVRWAAAGSWQPDAVVGVPGRARVVRRRGIDHTAVLAAAVAAALGVVHARPLVAGQGAGRQVGGRTAAGAGRDRPQDDGTPQVGGPEAWFAVVAPAPPRVLLVDDVLTSGATAAAAARALAVAGAREVSVAVLARSGRSPREPGGAASSPAT